MTCVMKNAKLITKYSSNNWGYGIIEDSRKIEFFKSSEFLQKFIF